MDKIVLELPVVGVEFLRDTLEGCDSNTYHGVSWCDAVRLATFGEDLVIVPGSIETCKWSPIILGLKQPENKFEESLEPRIADAIAGVRVAPLWRFSGDPDVLIVRGRPAQLKELARRLGPGSLTTRYSGQIGRTATGVGEHGLSARVMLSHASNRSLAILRRWKRFDDLTRVVFKDYRVTNLFEKLAKNAVADMSMCRNSTVLPFQEDAGNISFFCVGGVTWGGNSPTNITSGFPGSMSGAILEHLEFPGRAC